MLARSPTTSNSCLLMSFKLKEWWPSLLFFLASGGGGGENSWQILLSVKTGDLSLLAEIGMIECYFVSCGIR